MKDKLTAALLAIFLGGFGTHKFYLGRTQQGWLYVLFCLTGIPFLVGFIEGVLLAVMDDESFDQKYNPTAQHLDPFALAKSQADLLLKFKQLQNEGIITEEQFEAAKERTLRGDPPRERA